MLRKHSLAILSLVLLVQAGLFYSVSGGDSTSLAMPLALFPRDLGQFHLLQEGVVEPETLEVLKADDTLTRWYSSPVGGANLFIAYFKTQRTGQSPHSPKNCLPGSGFQPVENGTADIPINDPAVDTRSVHINRYLVSRGDSESLVMYWYQSHDRVIADEFAAKFYLILDSIRTHRSDTSLVRVVVPVVRTANDNGRATAQKPPWPSFRRPIPPFAPISRNNPPQ